MTTLKKVLKESQSGKLEDGVASLYAWAGIKTSYGEDHRKRFGDEVVDYAIKMAPRVLAYDKKLKQLKAKILNSAEAQILLATIEYHKGYAGYNDTRTTIGDLF